MKKLFVILAMAWMNCSVSAQEGYRISKQTIDGNERYGIVDASGKAITPVKYSWIDKEYHEGFILAVSSELKTVDNSNNPFAFSKTGTYWVRKYGFIDVKGKELSPFKYDYASAFSDGIAIVSSGSKFGLINTQGKEITPFKYEAIDKSYTDADLYVRIYRVEENGNKKYGLLSNNGKELTSAVYEKINPFYEGLAIMNKNNMMGVLNIEGKEVAAARYSPSDVVKFTNGMCRVNWNKKWGFIDKTGKEVAPLIYDEVSNFGKDGTAQVWQGTNAGRVDKTGKVIVPLKYSRVEPLSDGLFSVKQGKLYGWVDQSP